jgi:ribokinase
VVDIISRVRALPQAGEKGYFEDPEVLVNARIVGGVTLNHLAWASALGVPTGLFAFQGTDDNGVMVRNKMDDLGISTEHLQVGPQYVTSVSHIFLDTTGERCIMMAPASTTKINAAAMAEHFAPAVPGASIITSEISQVPLAGVGALFDAAAAAGKLSMLDVDVPPSVAVGEAGLGSMDEVHGVLERADVLKPTLSAAVELLAAEHGVTDATPLAEVAAAMAARYGSKLVVVTDGSRGSGLWNAAAGGVEQPCYGGVQQQDATGAGDAYFGGLVAGLHAWGLPEDAAGMSRLARVASAAGAACAEVLGALPVEGVSHARMLQLAADVGNLQVR